MQKNSFVLQTRLNAVVAKLSDKQAGILFKSILNYATNGIVANFEDSAVSIAFEFVKQDIDYNANKYAETCKRNADNGKLGGRPKKQMLTEKPSGFLENPKKANGFFEKHNDVDNDVVVDNELLDKSNNNKTPLPPLKEGKRFQKPTVEEIKNYCTERNNSIDAQSFFDFYESKGWKVGNTPMKDWRAAVRTWEKRNQGGKSASAIDYNGKDADKGKYDEYIKRNTKVFYND